MENKKEKRGHEDFANGITMSTESSPLRQQFIDAVRAASDLESVAATFERVVHQGPHILTQCPCHAEPTPSLAIETELRLVRCWMCLATGDVIWLVMEHEDICLRDAVRLLATRAGMTVPPDLKWALEDLQRPRATPDSQRKVLNIKYFDAPRRLRI